MNVVGVTDDFRFQFASIESGSNCTDIDTIDDNVYERNKVFTIVISSLDTSNSTIRLTVLLQDNEGKWQIKDRVLILLP